jgi:hypothetical protein
MELKMVVRPGGGIGIEVMDASLALLEPGSSASGSGCIETSIRRSKSLARRRLRESQAKLRSTTQRRGRTAKPERPAGRLTISSRNRSAAAAAAATAPW